MKRVVITIGFLLTAMSVHAEEVIEKLDFESAKQEILLGIQANQAKFPTRGYWEFEQTTDIGQVFKTREWFASGLSRAELDLGGSQSTSVTDGSSIRIVNSHGSHIWTEGIAGGWFGMTGYQSAQWGMGRCAAATILTWTLPHWQERMPTPEDPAVTLPHAEIADVQLDGRKLRRITMFSYRYGKVENITRCYLDPQRGFQVVRSETELDDQTVVIEAMIEQVGGCWMPVLIRDVTSEDLADRQSNMLELKLNVASVKVGDAADFDDSVFRLTIPTGWLDYSNQTTGTQFRMPVIVPIPHWSWNTVVAVFMSGTLLLIGLIWLLIWYIVRKIHRARLRRMLVAAGVPEAEINY